jgi:hypothetical protein
MKYSTLNFIRFIILVSVTFLFQSNSFGQTDYSFVFQDQKIEIPANISVVQINGSDISSNYNGSFYAWMQFHQIPNQSQQDAILASGVEFINYIAKNTYLVKLNAETSKSDLISNGVRGLISVSPSMKISSALRIGDLNPWAVDGTKAKLTLIAYDNISMDEVISKLQNDGVEILTHYRGYSVLDISISTDQILALGNYGFVKWVEEISAPPVKEDTRGKSLHRSSGLDTQSSTGRDYTGENIGVLVRDDGIVGPHIDFQGRIDNSSASGTGQTHGDGVSGILTGAGNLDPSMRGMAAGANLFVSNYGSSFLDAATTTRINNGTVQITNSSYGDGCNGGYTNNTVNVDNQIFNNPTLLHVFSAGNSGTSNCNYGAGSGWGNITGGHKQGKNVIATANLYFDGSLVSSSSRGPAYDGRIKPDIAANGQNQMSTNENNLYMSFGGTSGASPGIAGVSAQLYQAYQETNSGALPPSALIKATLLNTTNDAGNVGPDYKFGWGIVNGLRAGMLIEEGRHLTSVVSQSNNNNHTIAVPVGTKQVRFMLYWMDPAAANGASTALINDLDLVVTDPSSASYLPWILNPAPNATTLNALATNGADHLNNMEQVVINNPAAGSYTINVSGFAVPMGPQNYFVVYEIITDEITVTYPNRGEHFVPGEMESVHWDAPASTGSFTLEYSANNGGTWNTIQTVGSNIRTYQWPVPNNVTGTALFRVTRGGVSDVSDSIFSISPLVTGQNITQVCPTTMTFSWNPVTNAESYDVYALGPQYMEIIGNSTTTSYVHTITNPNAEIWYALVAKNATEGWEGRRTIASYYAGGLLNCSLPIDAELVSINNSPAEFSSICSTGGVAPEITILNGGTNAINNFTVTYQITGQPIVTETYTGTLAPGQQVNYTFTTPLVLTGTGNFTLTCAINATGDGNPTNNQIVLNFFAQGTASTTPFTEDFEATGFLPNGWSLVNPDSGITWEETAVTGSNGFATQAAFINNYSYNASGENDYFETEIFAVGGTYATLTFDLAKAQYNSFSDSLVVQISADCGTTYTTIYAKTGTVLATVPSTTSNWTPNSSNNWRNESVDISSYLGQDVSFRFINITDYSNSTYIDNINIASNLGIDDLDQIHFSLFPNPTNGNVQLLVSKDVSNETEILVTNQLGQIIQTLSVDVFKNNQTTIDLTNYDRGVYFVTIVSNGASTTKRIVKN